MTRAVRQLRRNLEREGFTVTEGKKHLKVYKDGSLVATVSRTPSDWRGNKNVMAKLRKAGYTGEGLQ